MCKRQRLWFAVVFHKNTAMVIMEFKYWRPGLILHKLHKESFVESEMVYWCNSTRTRDEELSHSLLQYISGLSWYHFYKISIFYKCTCP